MLTFEKRTIEEIAQTIMRILKNNNLTFGDAKRVLEVCKWELDKQKIK